MPPREWSMAKAQFGRHVRRTLHQGHGGVTFNRPYTTEILTVPVVLNDPALRELEVPSVCDGVGIDGAIDVASAPSPVP